MKISKLAAFSSGNASQRPARMRCPVDETGTYYSSCSYNGTTYRWNWSADPTTPTDPNPFRNSQPIVPSGLAIALIPRPAEAPLVWDMPDWNPVEAPCTSMDLKPAHARGVNVIYADCHAKFSPFVNRATRFIHCLLAHQHTAARKHLYLCRLPLTYMYRIVFIEVG